MSEYTARYQGVSHEELYNAVMAGKPSQIDDLAADWTSLKGILDGLGRELGGDLDKLANTWTGEAGQEYQRRLDFIVSYADTLGEGMADLSRALTLMADQLRTAHKEAESPEKTDDHDKAVSGAMKGAAFGLPGAIVGGLLGHQQDKAEQEKAHQRMVNVVAELAAGYDLSAYGRMIPPPPPPVGTPRPTTGGTTTPRGGPGATTPTAAPTSTGLTPQTGGNTVTTPDQVGSGPGTGSGSGGSGGAAPGAIGGTTNPDLGTSLAGAGPLTSSPVLGGAPPVGPGGGTMTASAGGGLGPLLGGAGGGLIGTGALAGSASSSPTTVARPTGGTAAAETRSASGVGRGMDGRRADGAARDAATARQGRAANRAGVLGGRGQQDDDASDDRLTWLTEDDMVWQDGADAAPPVLGTDR